MAILAAKIVSMIGLGLVTWLVSVSSYMCVINPFFIISVIVPHPKWKILITVSIDHDNEIQSDHHHDQKQDQDNDQRESRTVLHSCNVFYYYYYYSHLSGQLHYNRWEFFHCWVSASVGCVR